MDEAVCTPSPCRLRVMWTDRVVKGILVDIFNTPRGHPKSKPFVDRIMVRPPPPGGGLGV